MESKYRQEVAKFGKKDGLLALCVVLGYPLLSVAFAARWGFSMMWLLAIIKVGIIFLIVLRNKQGLSSIGLHKERLWPAVRLGLLFCLIPVLFVALIPGIYGGFNELRIGTLLVVLVTVFFFAAYEDIIFVGFVQTRLYGLFKTDRVAIPVGALIFALMHVPPWLMAGALDTSNLFTVGMQFFSWFLVHLVFVSIFKTYYSLVPIFILHTIINYSRNFAQTFTVFEVDFSLIALALCVLAACVLFWYTHKQSQKATAE